MKVQAKAPGGLCASLDLNEDMVLSYGSITIRVEYIGTIGRKAVLNVKAPKEVRIDRANSNHKKRKAGT